MSRIRFRYKLLAAALLVWAGSGLWQVGKPLPEGISAEFPWRPAAEVSFLADRTFVDGQGQRHSEQVIFDEILAMIGGAQRLVVVDMFLFNDFGGDEGGALRPLSEELTAALVERMAQVPGLRVLLVTDPVNTVYGGVRAGHLDRLEEAGAMVVETGLTRLRASNPAWSGPWALCCAWLGNSADGGWLPGPFDDERVTVRSWLALLNFRANHRKTLVVDDGDGWQALVTSANPHDASSAHDNVALRFSGAAALDVLASEAAVAAFSGVDVDDMDLPPAMPEGSLGRDEPSRLRVLTEGKIRMAVLDMLDGARSGDRLDLAMFYLSDRKVIAALKAAQRRGAALRVLLDPNEDAFGRKKNGVPNRSVADELVGAGVDVRWCDTHGEQCHAKFLLHQAGKQASMLLGSANFTRRNLADLNLETSVQWMAPSDEPAMRLAADWFDETWANEAGRRYSVRHEKYADDGLLHRWWYRLGEATGFSTW